MKYTCIANIINIAFLLGIVVIPFVYCTYDSRMSAELGGYVILGSFLLSIIAVTDWYYVYLCNSYRGIAWGAAVGFTLSTGILIIAAMILPASLLDLATLRNLEEWGSLRPLLRFYVAGIGMVLLAPYSLPRIWLIRWLTGNHLPQPK